MLKKGKMHKVSLNTETHTYSVDGVEFPGVTKILQGAGLIDLSPIRLDVLEATRRFGTACHRCCELHDLNDLNENSLDKHLRPYLNAWIQFKKDYQFKIEAIEEIVYSKRYRYAGRLDRRGIIEGKRLILDIKTSSDFGATVPIQLSAYLEAFNEGKKQEEKAKRRLAVLLNGDGKYKVEEYKNKSDFNVFISALTIVNWKKNNA